MNRKESVNLPNGKHLALTQEIITKGSLLQEQAVIKELLGENLLVSSQFFKTTKFCIRAWSLRALIKSYSSASSND